MDERDTNKKPDERDRKKRYAPGGAYKKKTPLSERIVNKLLSDDMMGIPDRLKEEFLYPRLEDLGYELVLALVGMVFHREPRGGYSRRRERDRYRDDDYRRDYSRYSDSDRVPARSNRRPSYDFGTIIFRDREGAKYALDCLKEDCEHYGQVAVSVLYETARLSGNGYTDNYYGWTDLRDVDDRDIHPTAEGGYVIDLPPVEKIRTR